MIVTEFLNKKMLCVSNNTVYLLLATHSGATRGEVGGCDDVTSLKCFLKFKYQVLSFTVHYHVIVQFFYFL